MNFDPNIALNYAISIARPRQVGSGEDGKVANEIEDRLRSFGFKVQQQPFAFSIAINLFTTLEILIGLLLIAAIFASLDQSKVFPAILLLIWISAANPINQMVRSRSVRLDETKPLNAALFLKTANLIAALPDQSENPSLPHLYLVAHYDSKSQRMPLVSRIALFVVSISASVLFASFTLLQAAINQSVLMTDAIGIIAFVCGLPLLLLDVNNDSPGAIDNASGVGLVLHLVECLSSDNAWRDKLQLTILIPSAEEYSLMGTQAYVQAHAEQLNRDADQVHFLNFDGIGVNGELRLIAPRRAKIGLARWLETACRDLDLPLGKFNLIGALYDHMPFARRGWDAVSLISIGQASQSIHTINDSIDKLHVRGFDQTGRVVLKLIENITASR